MLSLHDLDPSYYLGNAVHAPDFYLLSVESIIPYNIYECPFEFFLDNDAFIGVFVQAILAETGALEEF